MTWFGKKECPPGNRPPPYRSLFFLQPEECPLLQSLPANDPFRWFLQVSHRPLPPRLFRITYLGQSRPPFSVVYRLVSRLSIIPLKQIPPGPPGVLRWLASRHRWLENG